MMKLNILVFHAVLQKSSVCSKCCATLNIGKHHYLGQVNPWKNLWDGIMGPTVLTDKLCYVLLQGHALDMVVWEHYYICDHEHTWNWFPQFWKVYLAGIRDVLAQHPWTLTLRRQAFLRGCQGLPRRASWLCLFSCIHPAPPPHLTRLFINKDELASSTFSFPIFSFCLWRSLSSFLGECTFA